MVSSPLITNGTYRIKSESSNVFLECSNDGSVWTQRSNSGPSQQWNITPAGDGDYELQSALTRETLRVNVRNQLTCDPSLPRATWTLEPRGSAAYVIGNALDPLAIQLPENGPATVVFRNGGASQRWIIEPDTLVAEPMPRPNLKNNVRGFPTGIYFEIVERGTENCLLTRGYSETDGSQIHLWPRRADQGQRRSNAFFIDRTGALCHGSGLSVDIGDNVPVLRQRRPALNAPNPWSHPLPRFSYENSQIQIEFNSDPALPSCSEELYPNESWRYSRFLLAGRRNPGQKMHLHPLPDFQPWALRVPFAPLAHWGADIQGAIEWAVLVEPIAGSETNKRTQWDINPLTKV